MLSLDMLLHWRTLPHIAESPALFPGAGFGGSNVHCLVRANKPRAPRALTAGMNGLANGHSSNGHVTADREACPLAAPLGSCSIPSG